MVSMEDLNQNPLSNDPDIQRANPPLNQAIQQVGTSPRSINPEVNTQAHSHKFNPHLNQ